VMLPEAPALKGSQLPLQGATSGSNYEINTGPMTLQVNVSGQGSAQFVAGQVLTPEFVQAQ
jgi:hypothetical protein